jgi:omega-amidase
LAFGLSPLGRRSYFETIRSISHSSSSSAARLAKFVRRVSTVNPARMSTATSMSGKVRLALCQMPVCADKYTNIETAQKYLHRAKDAGAQLAVLPECFNCPYDTNVFEAYAEQIADPSKYADSKSEASDGPTVGALRSIAIDSGLFVVGGSIPELDKISGKVYNTSLTFAPTGAMLAKHRKVHLFDIDVPGGIRFKESETLSPGDSMTVFDAELSTAGESNLEVLKKLRVGVAICYDIRFPDLSMAMTRSNGASLLVFPGAFNMTTGPAHWELLARARAVDNQVFVAVCSPARWDESAGYTPWGHSMVVDPWGTVLATTEHGPDLVIADIDLARLDEVRTAIPTTTQQRPDVYV